MRVVGGTRKGRRLASFKGLSIRPTSDKVREAVFNILPGGFPFKKVLDLFAGTGAMGIEALSRGAEEAAFVDKDRLACDVIKKNLDACGFSGARVMRMLVKDSLVFFSRKGEAFDLIIIDPPYDSALLEDALRGIDREGLVNPGGFVVAESSKRAPLKEGFELKGLDLIDERRYGDTLVYFFNRRGLDA